MVAKAPILYKPLPSLSVLTTTPHSTLRLIPPDPIHSGQPQTALTAVVPRRDLQEQAPS